MTIYMISETGSARLSGSQASLEKAFRTFEAQGYRVATYEEWKAQKRWQTGTEKKQFSMTY